MPNSKLLSASAVLALAATLGGCAGTTGTKQPGVVADDTELVTPLGSHIPTPVRKGSTAPSASPTDTVNGDAARQMLMPSGANGQARGGN